MHIAIVTPWFGKSLTGGAERQAWSLAEGFAARGHQVSVFTTTSRSPSDDWALNGLPAGESTEGNVTIRRFAVERRNRDAFERANAYFLSRTTIVRSNVLPEEYSRAFVENNIRSQSLLAALEAASDVDAFVFIPYLYGPTLEGLPLVADRAFLQPCLHRECYALVPEVARAFHLARGLLFNSDGEAQLAQRFYSPGLRDKSVVVGQWIDAPQPLANGNRIGSLVPSRARYVVYLGRRDETKNVGMLIEAFAAYRRQNYESTLQLVLAGPGSTSYADEGRGILDVGFVTDAQRDALIEGSLALFQPSYNESFSRVMMESWAQSRPVVVNKRCVSMALPVQRSGGGWLAATKSEWADAFRAIDSSDASQLAEIGERGQLYYRANATADGVIERYEEAFAELGAPQSDKRSFFHLVSSDALSDDAVRRARSLATWSRYAGLDARVGRLDALAGEATLVLHSARPADIDAAAARERLGLCYDIVEFEDVRERVLDLAPRSRVSLATSQDAAELVRAAGAAGVQQIPFLADLEAWDVEPDIEFARELDDDRPSCLFVGTLSQRGRVDELITVFAFLLAFEVDARLIVAAPAYERDDRARVEALLETHRLTDRVKLVDAADASKLAAAYRAAALFWTLSENVSELSTLVDAMWFDIPVIAYSTPSVRALMGDAGILLSALGEPQQIAALAKIVLRDRTLRDTVIASQERRRELLTWDRDAGKRFARRLFAGERAGV